MPLEGILALQAELEQVRTQLRRHPGRPRMAVRIRTASPCAVRWELMQGSARVRRCSHCRRHVYDLSALTGDEAASLVLQTEGHLGRKLFRRWDGSVVTRDCPSPNRRLVLVGVAVGLGIAAIAALSDLATPDLLETPDEPTLDYVRAPGL